MKRVKSLIFNWRQVGSTQDRDGCGEDFDKYTVGVNGCITILEYEPTATSPIWSYVVNLEDGRHFRIFNPNQVEY